MHSKDIAKIAGVTVRTLRHYHQIGLLPEPPREANGYRTYGIRHLIRLLRIGQLTELGLPLAKLPDMLDGDEDGRQETLDELDDALARKIAVLEQQRRTIAALRAGDAPLDMPPEIARSLLSLEAGRSETAIAAGREQSVLLGHMVDADGRRELADLYGRLTEPGLASIVKDLSRRFDALGPHTDDQEISALAEAYLKHLTPWMKEYNAVINASANADAGALLSTHAMETTNRQQRRMIAELSARLVASL